MMEYGVLPGAIKRFDWLVLPSGRYAKVEAIDEDCRPAQVQVLARADFFGDASCRITFTLPFVRKYCKRLSPVAR